jgi:hypothetical protein
MMEMTEASSAQKRKSEQGKAQAGTPADHLKSSGKEERQVVDVVEDAKAEHQVMALSQFFLPQNTY